MMNSWQTKLFFRAAGLWGPSAKVLARTHGYPLNPQINTTPVTLLRSLVIYNRSFPPSQSVHTSATSVSHHIGSPSVASSILFPQNSCVYVCRGKSKKSRRKNYQRQEEDESDTEEEEEEMELEVGADFRDIRVRVPSLRMDALLKAGLNMSRNKVEAAFYASKIRINGEKFLKKSHQCHEGDEIDVIKGVSRQNPNNLHVSRVVVMTLGDMDEDNDMVIVKLRRYPNLLIECYKDYAPPEQEE